MHESSSTDRYDTVPASVVRAARRAFRYRRHGSVLAILTHDSVFSRHAGGRRARRISFRAPGTRIEVGMRASTLEGRATPSVTRAALLRTPRRTVRAVVSRDGRFRVESVPRGPGRLELVVEDRGRPQRVHTDWLTL